MTKRYLSGRAAAKIIGCSYGSIKALVEAKKLPVAAEDANGNNLYDPEVVQQVARDYIDGRTRAAREVREPREAQIA